MRWLESRVLRDADRVVVVLTDDADPGAVMNALSDLRGTEVDSMRLRVQDGRLVIDAGLRAREKGAHVEVLLGPLRQRDDVEEVDVG